MKIRLKRSLITTLGLMTCFVTYKILHFVSRPGNRNGGDSLHYRSWDELDGDVKLENENKEKLVEHFTDVLKDEESLDHQLEKTKLGPKAVFKEGVLGNYEPDYQIKTGPGEGGRPVSTTEEERVQAARSRGEYGFNMVNSDKISLDRTIPDTRPYECRYWHYPDIKDLPTASVIIVFHNEGWSTLLRTVHSVVNMSPKELLKEVVLVDDFSDKAHLKEPLEKYVREFNQKHNKDVVKLYRNTERLGLIRTRTRGAELSTADAIVFLDAHCECNRNWLVPLLARIAYDRTIMAVPLVDGIESDNFRYRSVYGSRLYRGIFEWGFLYKEIRVPQKELVRREHGSEPYRSPTHAGGLFAMNRKYFFEMGAYDEGLQIWGGENFELSFKIWQCGGSIEWVPCSHVGHIYRTRMPYSLGRTNVRIPLRKFNYMRVVEVWLDDEFKEYFYTREPGIRGYPVGNLTKQLKFKKDHNCKSFKWFMENVAYDVYDRFPALPPNKAWGQLKQKKGPLCWHTVGQATVGVSRCHPLYGSQLFRLNTEGQLGVGERCIEAPSGNTLKVVVCATAPTGPWDWDEETGEIRHEKIDKCVELGGDKRLGLQPCDSKKESQQWIIQKL